MEKLVESYDKENMKMAMLKHEHTFRHQVYELHRLYRIQKMLMKNITQENRVRTERWNVKNEAFLREKELDLEAEEQEQEQEQEEKIIIEESEIELTLGPSSYNLRRKKLATVSDSATSFSSSSSTTGSAQKFSRNCYRDGQFLDGSEMGFVGFLQASSGFQRGNNNNHNNNNINSRRSLEVEDEMRLSQLHHPWLYQVVSLNLT